MGNICRDGAWYCTHICSPAPQIIFPVPGCPSKSHFCLARPSAKPSCGARTQLPSPTPFPGSHLERAQLLSQESCPGLQSQRLPRAIHSFIHSFIHQMLTEWALCAKKKWFLVNRVSRELTLWLDPGGLWKEGCPLGINLRVRGSSPNVFAAAQYHSGVSSKFKFQPYQSLLCSPCELQVSHLQNGCNGISSLGLL